MANIFDLYRNGSALGGSAGVFDDNSLGYLDAVLRGQQRYAFDRNDRLGYLDQVLTGQRAPPPSSSIPDADGYTTFAEPPQPQPQPQPQTADVGTGIPLSLDRAPAPDTGEGTAWNQLKQAPGDILTAALGLLERAQLGGMNALGMRQEDGDIYRAKLPVEPGLRAAEGAATFATGGLANSLFPVAGTLRAGAGYAFPAARETAREATAAVPGLLADEGGALTLRQLQRRQIEERRRMAGSPLAGVSEDAVGGPPLSPLEAPPPPIGSNFGPPIEGVPQTPMGLLSPPVVSMGRLPAPGERALNPLLIPQDADIRLQRKLSRTDPTTGAPVNPEAIELPDGRHIGPVTTEQWINRVEKTLPSAEIEAAGNWYKEALPTYEAYFGREKAPAMMGAWLIANQNATPGFAQLSATRALEQYLNKTRGMPESLQAGLPADKLEQYWDAILSGDRQKLENLSTGQKIYDFIDSAAGKSTRTFYGDDPRAGRPLVADVHTTRDFGTVDPTLHEWVRKTYGDDVANRIQMDSASSPSETKYEWAADRGRQVTEDLNAMNWRGRNDWTPDQIQAIGWKTMSEMLGRPGQTAEMAIKESERFLSYELDFGKGAPWNRTFPEWKKLTPDEKATISGPILNKIMDEAVSITGAQEQWRMQGSGAWKQDINPAFRSKLLSSPEVVKDVANIIGYLGQQTATYAMRFANSGNKIAAAVHGPGLEGDKLHALWQAVYTRHPDLAGGFSPAKDAAGNPGIHIGFDGGGKVLEKRILTELLPTLDAEAKKLGLDIEGQLYRTENLELSNDWTKYRNGRLHTQRLGTRYGPAIQQRLDDFSRAELEPALRQAIDEALRQRGEAAGTAPAGKGAAKAVPKGLAGAAALPVGGLLGTPGSAEASPATYPGQPPPNSLEAILRMLGGSP